MCLKKEINFLHCVNNPKRLTKKRSSRIILRKKIHQMFVYLQKSFNIFFSAIYKHDLQCIRKKNLKYHLKTKQTNQSMYLKRHSTELRGVVESKRYRHKKYCAEIRCEKYTSSSVSNY